MDDPIEVVSEEELVRLEQSQKLRPTGGYKLPVGYLSHSQIAMYLRCAKQYYYRYVLGTRRPPSVAASHGSGTHHALETTHHHLVDHGVPAPVAMIEAAFSDKFEEALPDIPKEAWVSEGVKPGEMKDVGLQLVRLYNAKYAPAVRPQVTAEGVRGIEKRFEVVIEGVKVVGVIDLIDANSDGVAMEHEKELLRAHGKDIPEVLRTAVADFKTSGKTMSAGEVAGSMQLTLYSYVEQTPMVRFDQLLKQKQPKVKRHNSTRTKADHDWMKRVVTEVASAISAGVFPPCAPTDWVCSEKWCGFWHLCRGKRS